MNGQQISNPAHGATAERQAQASRIARLERAAHILDSQFELPIIRRRVGVDGLIGLIPGIGDTIGGAASFWMVAEAARGGARKRILARMSLNALIDATLGAIPLLGDLFDFAFKANLRNARLAAEELRRKNSMSLTDLPEGAEHGRRPTETVVAGGR